MQIEQSICDTHCLIRVQLSHEHIRSLLGTHVEYRGTIVTTCDSCNPLAKATLIGSKYIRAHNSNDSSHQHRLTCQEP